MNERGWIPLGHFLDEVRLMPMAQWFDRWMAVQGTQRIIQVSTRKYRARKGRRR